jgi:hypothetical protein
VRCNNDDAIMAVRRPGTRVPLGPDQVADQVERGRPGRFGEREGYVVRNPTSLRDQ